MQSINVKAVMTCISLPGTLQKPLFLYIISSLSQVKVKVATKRAEKFRAGKDQKENLGKLQNILCLELTAYSKVQVKHPEQTRIVETGHK